MVARLGVTVVGAMGIVHVVKTKCRSARGAGCYPAFMSNCWAISHTCQPYLLCIGVAVGPFEVSCGEGDAMVIGRVGMPYCDTSRLKIGCPGELNSLHSVHARKKEVE